MRWAGRRRLFGRESLKNVIFLKKVDKMFASSDFVVTFASAFEKNILRTRWERICFEKCKVLGKKFAGSKKMLYLCTTFRSEKRADGMKQEVFFIAI